MAKDFRKKQDEIIKRFEQGLKTKQKEFFELDSFEIIIDHYLEIGKHSKALKAVNMAFDMYPYQMELLVVKAQILSRLDQHDEALELLDKARTLFPADKKAC